MVCSSENELHVLKLENAVWRNYVHIHMVPVQIEAVVITDNMPLSISASTISDPTLDDIALDGPREESFQFEVHSPSSSSPSSSYFEAYAFLGTSQHHFLSNKGGSHGNASASR